MQRITGKVSIWRNENTAGPITSLIGKGIRALGKSLDFVGKAITPYGTEEKLMPPTQNVPFGSHRPSIDKSCIFIAPCATLIGQVTLGKKTSVFYSAIIRGDVNSIKIGDFTSIGARAMIHCSGTLSKAPTVIGNRVLVQPGSILHGCTIGDNAVIGEGAQVMDGATVGNGSIILPGSIVPPGKTVPEGQVWAGAPARFYREVTIEEQEHYEKLSNIEEKQAELHAGECSKTWREVEETLFDISQEDLRPGHYPQRMDYETMSQRKGEIEYHDHPGRIFDHNLRVNLKKGPKMISS